MARRPRIAPAGIVQHVCNRGSRRGPLFDESEDYRAFICLLEEARALHALRIIAYCLMPNHWHLLLWPHQDQQVSPFMHWLTATHARAFRRATETVGQGAVYQGRFKSVAVEDAWHFFIVCRYVERNPVAASLCERAQDWRWSSASQRPLLKVDPASFPLPATWSTLLNQEDLLFESDGM
jgi:putative transposase